MAVQRIPFLARSTNSRGHRFSRRWSLHIDVEHGHLLVERTWCTTDADGDRSGRSLLPIDHFVDRESDSTILRRLDDALRLILRAQVR